MKRNSNQSSRAPQLPRVSNVKLVVEDVKPEQYCHIVLVAKAVPAVYESHYYWCLCGVFQ